MDENYRSLLAHINAIAPLSAAEEQLVITSFHPQKVKKRQFIVQPGFVAQYRHYVVQGAFRSYVVTDGGLDFTIALAVDHWWITDYNSFIAQQPATMFTVALEDSSILRLDYTAEQQLKQSAHALETFFRVIAERGLAAHQRRIINSLTLTAEERYDAFVQRYPHIVQRVPQYVLASYLGMTTEFLSRIRNRRVGLKS